jgi:hypothetical protein
MSASAISFRLRPCGALIALAIASFLAGRQMLFAQQQIPEGTIIPVLLETTLDSAKIKTGQRVLAEVGQDISLGTAGTIRVGSKVVGYVTTVGREPGRSTVALHFDDLLPRKRNKHLSLEVRLRALASPLQVNDAGVTTTNGVGWSNESSNWTTDQVGGDVVYRGGGHIVNSYGEIVGEPVHGGLFDPWSGVLGQASNPTGSACQNLPLSKGQQSLWIFSSSACGVYGFSDVRYENLPNGDILFSAPTRLKISGGSALMLTVSARTPAKVAQAQQ